MREPATSTSGLTSVCMAAIRSRGVLVRGKDALGLVVEVSATDLVYRSMARAAMEVSKQA
jgi:hypothetical protein